MAFERILSAYREHPYRNIFLCLMGIVLVDALFRIGFAHGLVTDLSMVAILTAALWETVRSRRNAALALVFGLPAIGSRLLSAVTADSPFWNSSLLVITALFFGFLIWNLLHDIQRAGRPTGERIFGALCAYVFIGMLFALVYTHIEYRAPGSFVLPDRGPVAAEDVESALLPEFVYFSFVTLTTLGYGDIQPVAEHARTLSWMEALIGQLFLAVMVAGFVAAHMTERSKQSVVHDGSASREEREDGG
jgi:hypothetical protein